MVVELLAKVLDQGIVHHIEEIVRRRPTVMLLRVEPAGRDVGVPGEHHAAAGGFFPECASNAGKWGHNGGCPCSQQCAPRQYCLRRRLLPEKREGRRERRAGAAPTMPAGMARRCFRPARATALYLPRRFFLSLAQSVAQLCKIVSVFVMRVTTRSGRE